MSVTAPVKGWNALNALQDMEPEFAIQLDNWIPRGDFVQMRLGQATHATGIGSGDVETLIVWHGGASSKMLACGNNAIYDATNAGAVGAALSSGKTSNRWQYVNFNGQVVAVNGSDTPIQYNGTAVSNSTLTGTGLTPADLIHVNIYKERLFFVEKDTLSVWYLPVKSITGTATEFDMSFLFRKGGNLVAMVTHSRDGGAGIDDFAAFITSEGEVAVYQGIDPSTAADWALVGLYNVGKPIGRRCFVNYGAEVLLITQSGVLPLSQVLPVSNATNVLAISRNIENAFNRASQESSSLFGWEPVLYPEQDLLMFNIPTTSSVSFQYVMDTNTEAWCRFTGFNGKCWAELDGRVYYGMSGGVVKRGLVGTSDAGNNIVADARQAFNYFKTTDNKLFRQIRPTLEAAGLPDVYTRLDMDFRQLPITVSPSAGVSTSTPWGSPWGSAWSSSSNVKDEYIGVEGIGRAASLVVRAATNLMTVKWVGTDFIFERGNFA